MKFQHHLAILAILLSTLACRPVLTIGWSEIFILGIILLVLVGPSMWRFYKGYRKFKKHEKDKVP